MSIATTPTGAVISLPRNPVVLVVGSPAALSTVQVSLDRVTSRVDRCGDEDLAFTRIQTEPPDLLVMDASMAGAFELCRRLKQKPSTNGLPIIVYGGAGTEQEARQRAIDSGADHWLSVEIPEVELRSRALHLLRAHGLFHSLFEITGALRIRRDWVRYLIHDLRSPLTVIMANLDFVAPALQDPELAAALKESQFAVLRMSAMLQDLLDVDRLQSGELQLRRASLDLAQVVQQAATDVRLLLKTRGLELSVHTQSCHIDGDHSIVERMIANLVSNALRYARRSITLSLERSEKHVLLRVANDGPGLAPELREHIFVPFVRLDDEGARSGAGLGLAFCRIAATAHGGSAEVENGADGQVCFRLTFPVHQP